MACVPECRHQAFSRWHPPVLLTALHGRSDIQHQERGRAGARTGRNRRCRNSLTRKAGFTLALAISAGIFYGLAGIRHFAESYKSRNENIAMVIDLFVFLILAVYVIFELARNRPGLRYPGLCLWKDLLP